MKVFKIEIMIIDFDEIGEDGIKSVIENTKYPNRCINPEVKGFEFRDIGEWYDENPLNFSDKSDEEYKRLFNEYDSINKLDEVRTLRPDMGKIEEMFRIFGRPDAESSHKMVDYIYALERRV